MYRKDWVVLSVSAEIYYIMIASPSDMQEARKKVAETIDSWNQELGFERRLFFRVLRWEEDVVPEVTGKDGQTNINEQLCDKSDIVLALFGKKLGTPTKCYPSGTVEEIEVHIKQGKLAYVLFAENKGIDVTSELSVFRKQMENRCCCRDFKSLEELQNNVIKILKHIATKVRDEEIRNSDLYSKNSSLIDVMWAEMDAREAFLQYQIDQLAKASIQNSLLVAETRENNRTVSEV